MMICKDYVYYFWDGLNCKSSLLSRTLNMDRPDIQ